MKTSRLSELVGKYLEGNLSDAEKKELHLLMDSPDNRTELEKRFLQEWENTEYDKGKSSDEQSRLRIERVLEKVHPKPKRNTYTWPWLSVACFLLLCLLIPFFWQQGSKEVPEVANVPARHEVHTAYGQKKTLRMADGTIIFLNAGSTLEYTDDFSRKNRKVKLTGEAYFEVSTDKNLPFIVEGQGIYAHVLGTSFNFRAFEEDSEVAVALESGALRVGKLDESVSDESLFATLKPGQKMIYHKAAGKIAVRTIGKLDAWGIWRNEVLAFDSKSFGQVALILERWYDVKVHFSDSKTKSFRFTGSFDNLSVNRVLDLLKKGHHFSYRIEGKNIYIE
ncbi:FecR family protein [Olivibacter sitiensis]|uniref:FecR family protein n=1 Tax=Olivibacter sitiensis TaxID=376470 RepID=UPI0004187FC7|nr:FecR domain-containing protein [Olivibacter sitiensis]